MCRETTAEHYLIFFYMTINHAPVARTHEYTWKPGTKQKADSYFTHREEQMSPRH